MKTMAIIGTRPQLIKVSREWADIIINTGQHYDQNLNDIHDYSVCDYNIMSTELGQTITLLIDMVGAINPDIIFVIGDTKSTMAGAIAAKMMNKTLIHIEAGMRCYDNSVIEERIRVSVDRLSDYLLTTDVFGSINLAKEGFNSNIHVVGDPLFDRLVSYGDLEISESGPNLMTLHRADLVDNKHPLVNVLSGISNTNDQFIWPIHPRALKSIKTFNIDVPQNITIIEPLPHSEIINIMANSKKVISDSGGIQREAYWMDKPVIIPRDTTEHKFILNTDRGILTGYNAERLSWAIKNFNVPDTEIIEPPCHAHKNIKRILDSIGEENK